MTQLVQLEGHLGGLAAWNTVVVAISADEQVKVDETVAKHNITFPVLRDPELRVIKNYRALHPTGKTALPVTYIIDPSGTIRWRYYQGEPHHPTWDLILEGLDSVQREDGVR